MLISAVCHAALGGTARYAVGVVNAFRPSSPTKVFSGSNLVYALAADGSRYGKLTNAFAFRKTLVPNCTCNGKDHFGLTRVDGNADPTLRPGDIVATANGRVTTAARDQIALGKFHFRTNDDSAKTYSDKKNVIAVTLTRLTNKADTSGRITKALGDGPYRLVTAVMAAIAVGVEPSDMPANPALSTAAW